MKLIPTLSEIKDTILKTFIVWLALSSVSCDYYKQWSVRFVEIKLKIKKKLTNLLKIIFTCSLFTSYFTTDLYFKTKL